MLLIIYVLVRVFSMLGPMLFEGEGAYNDRSQILMWCEHFPKGGALNVFQDIVVLGWGN